jgi:hypothetical protein
MSLYGDILKYFGVAGSTERARPGHTAPDPSNLRRLRCDDDGYLEVTFAPAASTDVNLIEIDGNSVSSGGVTGVIPVTGDVADDAAASASYPVKVGAVADDVPTAVADGDQVHLITDLYRRLRVVVEGDSETDTNLIEISGTSVVEGGVAGSLGVGGNTAAGDPVPNQPVETGGEDPSGNLITWALDAAGRAFAVGTQAVETAVDDSSWPVKVAARVRDTLTTITDDHITNLLSDTYGRLWVQGKYDSGKMESFSDGASGAKSLTDGSWTTTSGTEWISSGDATNLEVCMEFALDGAETSLKARLRTRVDSSDSTEYRPLATNGVSAGEEDVDEHEIVFPLAGSGSHNWSYLFPCSVGREYAVDFYQADGSTTEVQAYFNFYR